MVKEFLLSRETLVLMVRFVLPFFFLKSFFKAWLEIVYNSCNSINADLSKLSSDLLIFIFISHPADKERLLFKKKKKRKRKTHHYPYWRQIRNLWLHCSRHLTDKMRSVGAFLFLYVNLQRLNGRIKSKILPKEKILFFFFNEVFWDQMLPFFCVYAMLIHNRFDSHDRRANIATLAK